MKPEKEKVKEAEIKLHTGNENNANNSLDSKSRQSRRQFIKTIGGLIFGLTLVDKTARYVFACPSCNSPGSNDASCNSPGDQDKGCGSGNKDEGCSTSQTDDNCHTNGAGSGKGDEDQSCGSNNADEGCGDCNDKHDDDNNCGNAQDQDQDQMCGHVHTIGPMDTDDNCQNVGDSDQGCGAHDGPGTPNETDTDEGCNPGPPDTDQNCTGQDSDNNCSTNGANTSTPDEHCQQGASYDEDNACEQWFDIDEACGHSSNDQDQGCGGKDTSASPIIVSDEDQNCGNTIGQGGPTDADDRCGIEQTWPLPVHPDNT